MTSNEIRKKFIDYFTKTLEKKNMGHTEVHSSRVVPEFHPTLLFTNSGMVQFTPYFLGQKNPEKDFGSKRLCSVQKCIRTIDLDKIGKSKYHLTFFEMLGSWSIGDYGKKEAVEFSYDLLTNKDHGFGFDGSKFIPTVFCGNDEAPCDTETIEAWKSVGIDEKRISKLPSSDNWWSVGGLKDPGPCGPCTEILYDRGPQYGPEEEVPGMTDNPRYLEIWNAGVFMQFDRDQDGKLHPLKNLSVDTGAGLERFTLLLQGVDSVYETDLFVPIIDKIKELQRQSDTIDVDFMREDVQEAIRRISDHVKASTIILSENVFPSNKDQGFVLRRLIRTAFADAKWKLGIEPLKLKELIPIILDMYKDQYPEVSLSTHIEKAFEDEYQKYEEAVKQARHVIKRKYLYKHKEVDAFVVYQSTGADFELIKDISEEFSLEVDQKGFEAKMLEHQEKSRKGAGKKFKGGLSGDDPTQRKLHTATHLLHQALREVLGDHVQQMGSNINPERLRFDFSHQTKMTEKEITKVEQIVNKKINEKLPVNFVKMAKAEAEKSGALHFFKEKYGDEITIYYVGDSLKKAWSKEFCGGPHVKNTLEIGCIKIQKEEGISKGIRRIKAVLC